MEKRKGKIEIKKNKNMDEISRAYIDNFIKPMIEKVLDVLIEKRVYVPCLICGNLQTRVDVELLNIVYTVICACGSANKTISVPIVNLIKPMTER